MIKPDMTDADVERVRKALADAHSTDGRTRQAATLEIKKLTVLFGRDALEAVEDSLIEETYDLTEQDIAGRGGWGIVWD